MPSGSVMTPTMTRMAYLTLRGLSISRLISTAHPSAAVLEVHPFGALALAGAPVEAVRSVKHSEEARIVVAQWMREHGMEGLPDHGYSDHELAALAAGFAAWKWQGGKAAWYADAEPPLHPYPFAC